MKLTVQDATVGYDRNQPLQEHVTFSVESGQVCCVLGPNGCGKTTLLRAIMGTQELLGGSIAIDGVDTAKWSPEKIAGFLAYVPQRQNLPFTYLVKDAVMLGRIGRSTSLTGKPNKKDVHLVQSAMVEMGIDHLRDKPLEQLSEGEFQLVMFAKALAQEPQMLVLDEPTAALDYRNAVAVVEKVRGLATAGYGVLMVTHNPDHAFMAASNVALFSHDDDMKFGSVYNVVNKESIRRAFGTDVRVTEFTNKNQQVMRVCTPEFGGKKN